MDLATATLRRCSGRSLAAPHFLCHARSVDDVAHAFVEQGYYTPCICIWHNVVWRAKVSGWDYSVLPSVNLWDCQDQPACRTYSGTSTGCWCFFHVIPVQVRRWNEMYTKLNRAGLRAHRRCAYWRACAQLRKHGGFWRFGIPVPCSALNQVGSEGPARRWEKWRRVVTQVRYLMSRSYLACFSIRSIRDI